MALMREWMDLVEQLLNERPASAQLIHRVTADTDENRKHLELLAQYEKEIEGEETQSFAIPDDVRRSPEVGSKEWETDRHLMNWELDKRRRKEQAQRQREAQKAQQEHEAKIQGIRLAAKDAMDDLIEKDREVVSKLAQQALKSANRNKQQVRKQAMRQLKK